MEDLGPASKVSDELLLPAEMLQAHRSTNMLPLTCRIGTLADGQGTVRGARPRLVWVCMCTATAVHCGCWSTALLLLLEAEVHCARTCAGRTRWGGWRRQLPPAWRARAWSGAACGRPPRRTWSPRRVTRTPAWRAWPLGTCARSLRGCSLRWANSTVSQQGVLLNLVARARLAWRSTRARGS